MGIYENLEIGKLLESNTYPGRGIIIGKTADGGKAVCAYFIMGRSVNSCNRIFIEQGNEVVIHPFDPSKLQDPSLVIYSPIKVFNNNLIVTNGDQTDTVYDTLSQGGTFEQALDTRQFEPDPPNLTPRISGMLTFNDNDFTYKMSILKSADADGSACNRYTFAYSPVAGVGYFIHTYNCDGNPLPTFTGEPERISISGDIDSFANNIWNSLNTEYKVSLYVRYIDLKDGGTESRLFNKNV